MVDCLSIIRWILAEILFKCGSKSVPVTKTTSECQLLQLQSSCFFYFHEQGTMLNSKLIDVVCIMHPYFLIYELGMLVRLDFQIGGYFFYAELSLLVLLLLTLVFL